MFLAREMTGLSLPRLGTHFARDHTTILHAVRRITRLMADDPALAREVEGCRELLPHSLPPSVRHAGKRARYHPHLPRQRSFAFDRQKAPLELLLTAASPEESWWLTYDPDLQCTGTSSGFQHYKDRSAPWIKLYNELLDDYRFAVLPDASKWHLVAYLAAGKPLRQ